MSSENIIKVDISTVRHLGLLRKGFDCAELKEDKVYNADETHFFFNIVNGKTLRTSGDQQICYEGISSGFERITMLDPLSDDQAAIIEPSILTLRTKIGAILFEVSLTTFREFHIKCTKRLDGHCNHNQVAERRTFDKCTAGRRSSNSLRRQLQLSQTQKEDVLNVVDAVRTTLRYFPARTTDLIQPCNLFVIQKLKDAW